VENKSRAPTAEALMRSRYTAYTLGKIDYIFQTTAPESRKSFDRKGVTEWSQNSQWLGLEIHNTEQGQPGDTQGFVEFTARYVQNSKREDHNERSLFRFDAKDHCWYFVDAVARRSMPIVKAPEPGRNDPCPCGSGKKYKKCCAA
jgi:SEC-C motif-containing protein